MRSRVRVSGCKLPAAASGLVKVGSTAAPSAAPISEFSIFCCSAAKISSTAFFASLINLPTTGRSSLESVAMDFITAVSEPLGPTMRAL